MEFKEGDVVELKSGGVKMTIVGISDGNAELVYWNEKEAQFCSDFLPTNLLRKVEQ